MNGPQRKSISCNVHVLFWCLSPSKKLFHNSVNWRLLVNKCIPKIAKLNFIFECGAIFLVLAFLLFFLTLFEPTLHSLGDSGLMMILFLLLLLLLILALLFFLCLLLLLFQIKYNISTFWIFLASVLLSPKHIERFSGLQYNVFFQRIGP